MSFELLSEWLSEVHSLSDDDVSKIVASTSNGANNQMPINPNYNFPENADLVRELTSFIEGNYDDCSCFEQLCDQLLSLYFKGEFLRIFVIQFIPAFVRTYLIAIAQGNRKDCIFLETFLIALYNCEICESPSLRPNSNLPDLDEGMHKKVENVNIPSLSLPSIYHDPNSLCSGNASLPTSEVILNRLSPPSNCSPAFSNNVEDTTKPSGSSSVQIGPFPSFTRFTSENRLFIITRLIMTVNEEMAKLHVNVVKYMCNTIAAVCRNGFHFVESDMPMKIFGCPIGRKDSICRSIYGSTAEYVSHARVTITAPLLLQLTNSLYYGLFNDAALEALEALDSVHQRAQFELFPDVLVVTNAVLNSLEENPSGTPREGPMGIRVTSSHLREGSRKGNRKPRELITNASLKMKRMPEDIPIRDSVECNEDSPKQDKDSRIQQVKDLPVFQAAKKIMNPHKIGSSLRKDKDKEHKNNSSFDSPPDSGRPLLENDKPDSSNKSKNKVEHMSMSVLSNGDHNSKIDYCTRSRGITDPIVSLNNTNPATQIKSLNHSASSTSGRFKVQPAGSIFHSASNGQTLANQSGALENGEELNGVNEQYHTPVNSSEHDEIRHADSIDDLSDD